MKKDEKCHKRAKKKFFYIFKRFNNNFSTFKDRVQKALKQN